MHVVFRVVLSLMRTALVFSQSQAFFSIDLKVRKPNSLHEVSNYKINIHIVNVDGTLTRKLFAFIDVSGNYSFSFAPGESEVQVYPGKSDGGIFLKWCKNQGVGGSPTPVVGM